MNLLRSVSLLAPWPSKYAYTGGRATLHSLRCLPFRASSHLLSNDKNRPSSAGRFHYWLAAIQVPTHKWQVNASCFYFVPEIILLLRMLVGPTSRSPTGNLIIDLCVRSCQHAFT